MQGESLKIVSNSSSCREQPVGRKWSPGPLPFLPHSPPSFPAAIPLSAWFSTPLPLLTCLFPISPPFHPQADSVRAQLDVKMKVTQREPVPWLAHYVPCPHPVCPTERYRAPSPRPGWAPALLFLIWFSFTVSQPKDKSAPTAAPGHPSPAGVGEHNQGQGIRHGKRTEATNAPAIFHPLLGPNCFSVKGCNRTRLLARVPHTYSVKPLSIFSTSIIPKLPWINDGQDLTVSQAISLVTLLINSRFTIESFILRSRRRFFSWSCIIWLYFHKSY